MRMREADESGDLRIDKWLWHARFFKSRSLATGAVSGGHVHVNDERVKPSRTVGVGDRLTITRADERLEVLVRAIPLRRGPATEAQACYEETPESIAARERRREFRKLRAPAPDARPGKHDRRALRDLKGR